MRIATIPPPKKKFPWTFEMKKLLLDIMNAEDEMTALRNEKR
jgi:hypothetical protein